jgi:hypothetical protein
MKEAIIWQKQKLQKQDYLRMTILYRTIHTQDRDILQQDLHHLELWGLTWGIWNSIQGNVTPCPSQDQGHQ